MSRPHRCLWALLLLMATGAPASADVGGSPRCPGPDGRHPVIEAGREGEIRRLFAPHVPGEALGGDTPGWIFREVTVRGDAIEALLEGPDVARVRLRLRPKLCDPGNSQVTASFLWTVEGARDPAEQAAADRLLAAVTNNDQGGFYRVTVEIPPPLEEPTPAVAEAPEISSGKATPPQPAPWNRTHLALGLLLLLALVTLAMDGRGILRDVGFNGTEGHRAAAWLVGITTAGGLVRWLTPATFMREAYPLPNVAYLLEPVGWDRPISIYPQGQQILTSFLSPLLSSHPYDAWFQANALLGTLTIPAAFLLGASLLGQRRAGLVAAALLAFWPQHIRFSASESTHVGFVLWATLALGLGALAANSGRLRTWAATVFAAGAALTMRPEAPVFLPALAVLLLAHGDGVRRQLKRPGYLVVVLVAAWLLVPWILDIALDESAAAFTPDSHRGEAIGLHSLGRMARVLLLPTPDNAFFDPATTPLWLYPVACWGLFRGLRAGPRGAAAGLLVGLLSYVLLYSGMEIAVTIWGMGRYHLSAIPFVLAACTMGVMDLWVRVPALAARPQHQVPAVLAVAILGAALWWPAVRAVPMDWQQELHWLIDLGRAPETRVGEDTRLVVPDNRRRFRDLSPRTPILALSAGARLENEAFTVAQAVDRFFVEPDATPTYYLEGLYCHLALGPGERLNPQCEAMKEIFDLEHVASLHLDGPPFLTAYASIRSPAPLDLTLYRVVGRRLPPQEARGLLPPPWPAERSPPPGFSVIGSPTDASMAPDAP